VFIYAYYLIKVRAQKSKIIAKKVFLVLALFFLYVYEICLRVGTIKIVHFFHFDNNTNTYYKYMFIYTVLFTGIQILDCSAHCIIIQDSEKHWTRSATCIW